MHCKRLKILRKYFIADMYGIREQSASLVCILSVGVPSVKNWRLDWKLQALEVHGKMSLSRLEMSKLRGAVKVRITITVLLKSC